DRPHFPLNSWYCKYNPYAQYNQGSWNRCTWYRGADVPYDVVVDAGMPSYSSQIDGAVTLWNNTGTALYVHRVANASDSVLHVHVRNGTNGTAWGYGSPTWRCGYSDGCETLYATIDLY